MTNSHDYPNLFLPGQSFIALPNAKRAKLYVPNGSVSQRWTRSQLYPAFRPRAKLYRLALRARAAAGLGKVVASSDAWVAGEFAKEVLPGINSAVVLIGTNGPAQKITVQLWKDNGIIGYLKYAYEPVARIRLEREHRILTHLPENIGPAVLKFGSLADGLALITSPVAGKQLPIGLPPTSQLQGLLTKFTGDETFTLDEHPWVQALREEHGSSAEAWLAPLSKQRWPVVTQHGDFAPWNVFREPNGSLRTIDWEYGNLVGFPYHDLCYYLFQVAALIHRWSPEKTRSYAETYLSRAPWPGLDRAQAESIVKLCAFSAYHQFARDGEADKEYLQSWRKTIWKS